MPISENPNLFWIASDGLLKWKTPDLMKAASVTSKYQPITASTASLMIPRPQNGWPR